MKNKLLKIKKSDSPMYKYQAGLSLVDLLVSMSLGAFLMGGVITSFIGTKEGEKTRSAISEMDANARVALGSMRQTIQHAGYSSIYNVRLEKPFYTTSDGVLKNPLCRGGSIKRDAYPPKLNYRTQDSGRTDVLTVITLADNPCKKGMVTCPDNSNVNPKALIYYDCAAGGADRTAKSVTECSADPEVGMKDPTEAKIFSTFWVNRDRTLYCRGSRGNTQPLVDNIEYMQFLYGVKKDDGTTSYRPADNIDTSSEWEQVTSVQIAILVRSSSNVLKKPSSKKWYTLLDERREINEKDLRRLFRIYTTTVNLENKNSGALL